MCTGVGKGARSPGWRTSVGFGDFHNGGIDARGKSPICLRAEGEDLDWTLGQMGDRCAV